MMKHWALCVGLVVVAGVALLAGLPALYLLLLACPLMMMTMMFLMPGMHGSQKDRGRPPAAKLDGSHERIDHP